MHKDSQTIAYIYTPILMTEHARTRAFSPTPTNILEAATHFSFKDRADDLSLSVYSYFEPASSHAHGLRM